MTHNNSNNTRSQIKISKIFSSMYDTTQSTSFVDEEFDLENSYLSKPSSYNQRPQGLSTSLSSKLHRITENIMSKLSSSSSSPLPLHHHSPAKNPSAYWEYPYSQSEKLELVCVKGPRKNMRLFCRERNFLTVLSLSFFSSPKSNTLISYADSRIPEALRRLALTVKSSAKTED
ncbi:9575_t:CDS:2 [Acaulospora colombiana]|uniref:9575_t:CDS:1 n=1 Tax=Acaulospora colombiana TaxID=27376 RepID=A0ACA9K3P2_9GLOM|nr:9575_t:CDS:2 [Acaulospora colombiana]